MLNTMPQLKVLRHVEELSQGALSYLWDEYERRRISIDPVTNQPRADVIAPSSGWIDNDLPRDEAITNEIMEQTTGFAVADYYGQPFAKFKTLAEAEKARRGAKVKLDVSVEGIEDEAEVEDNGKLAGQARRSRDVVPV